MKYFLSLFVLLLASSPWHAFAASSPFYPSNATGFVVSLSSPTSGGKFLSPTTISGSYDSSKVSSVYGYICMVPFVDASSWNAGGASHLVFNIGTDFTNQNFWFSPAFACWPRPKSNTGYFGYNYPFPLGGHTVGILAMALNTSSTYCGAGANAPCYSMVGLGQSFGPISFTVATSIPNNPPVATLLIPNNGSSFDYGRFIAFDGYGTDPDTGDYIASYEWRDGSCSSGTTLSTDTYFYKSDLSPGLHVIYFRVQDSHGAWSPCVSTTISISVPTVHIQFN